MLITILTFLLILGFLVLAHELGHFLTARKLGVAVEEFGLGFPPRLVSKKIKNTIYSLNLIPLGGFVKIKGEDGQDRAPDSFVSQSVALRMIIIVAGVTMNLLAAWLVITILFLVGAPGEITADANPAYIKEKRVLVTMVLPDSPAFASGIAVGDKILNANGLPIDSPANLQEAITQSNGQEMVLRVQRQARQLELKATPRLMSLDRSEEKTSIGVGLVTVGKIKLPPHLAVWQGAKTTGKYLARITAGLANIFKNLWKGNGLGEDIGGPVAIAVVVGGATEQGFSQVLLLTAILSLNLALINILPFPALDGGRLIFLLAEKIRGRPSREVVEAWFHQIGFALLILFAVFITYRDLVRFGGQIWQAMIN